MVLNEYSSWVKSRKAVILDRQTFYKDAEDTYQGIKHVDIPSQPP